MKNDSGVRFEVNKSIEHCMYRTNLSGDERNVISLIMEVLEAGIVTPEPESKKDTIEIDRAVAEEWIVVEGKTLEQCRIQHTKFVAAVKKALSEGRKS